MNLKVVFYNAGSSSFIVSWEWLGPIEIVLIVPFRNWNDIVWLCWWHFHARNKFSFAIIICILVFSVLYFLPICIMYTIGQFFREFRWIISKHLFLRIIETFIKIISVNFFHTFFSRNTFHFLNYLQKIIINSSWASKTGPC